MINDNFEEQNQIHNAPDAQAPQSKEGWERDVLERLAFATLNEQRARRRWNTFFRFLTLAIIAAGVWIAFGLSGQEASTVGPHTALIEIDSTIESGTLGSADSVI